jgi:hypothetical protein
MNEIHNMFFIQIEYFLIHQQNSYTSIQVFYYKLNLIVIRRFKQYFETNWNIHLAPIIVSCTHVSVTF